MDQETEVERLKQGKRFDIEINKKRERHPTPPKKTKNNKNWANK